MVQLFRCELLYVMARRVATGNWAQDDFHHQLLRIWGHLTRRRSSRTIWIR